MPQSLYDSPTMRKHRRQFLWQIILPFCLVLLLVLAGAVLVTIGGDLQARLWGDISIIWLIVPALFLALIGMILLGALIYGVARLIQAAPRFTSRAQDLAMRIRSGARQAADTSVKPILWVKQAKAVIATFLSALKLRSRK